VPKEAHLRCRLQEPHGRFEDAFARCRLTKRSREHRHGEVRRTLILRTLVNRAVTMRSGSPGGIMGCTSSPTTKERR
jgi:hypothetical protein